MKLVSLKRCTAIFVASDGQRFIVRADEKLTAFAELKSAIPDCRELS